MSNHAPQDPRNFLGQGAGVKPALQANASGPPAPTWKRALPGYIGLGLAIITTSMWTFWGTAEMFYEGWWGVWYLRPAYLVLGAACLLLTLLAVAWPRVGGWVIVALGSAFTAFWWSWLFGRGWTLAGFLSVVPVSAMFILVGVLFLLEANYRRKSRFLAPLPSPSLGTSGMTTIAENAPPSKWWRRNWRFILALGIPLVTALVTAAYALPYILTRQNDGNFGARLIEGNGVRLVWAPAGPGWARGLDQSRGQFRASLPGENPGWNEIALYGVPPAGYVKKPGREGVPVTAKDMQETGLCGYLGADGTTLLETPPRIWRMPTTDEFVRSLALHGKNAGCTWDGKAGKASCKLQPDKETPLWNPEESPIYMWTADEFNEKEAWYVAFAGWTNHQPKQFGNSRHGFRCVREP